VSAERSAGLVIFRRKEGAVEVFLVHPGGPFWARKEARAWSIPKGLLGPEEDPLAAAVREFKEETGLAIRGTFRALTARKQPSGKIVFAFAVEADPDPAAVLSNTFEMEWPPRSGRRQSFPEIDRAAWFSLTIAREKLHRGQVPFLDDLATMLAAPPAPGACG
jgi:predicted NUDIX family NTP pyrophosphohydrolase